MRNELPCQRRPNGVVFIRDALPAFVFEASEFFVAFAHSRTKWLALFQRKFDALFLLAGDEPVALNDPGARVPAE